MVEATAERRTMNVILIGPIGAGKSTLGKLIAAALGVPQISLDNIRFKYYREIGYDDAVAKLRYATDGFWGLYRYWKPFEAHAVERVLAEHTDCTIDLGAGHSVYEDEALLTRVKKAFAPHRNVVLVLPSPDPVTSLKLLQERRPSLRDIRPDINEHFITHRSNYELATLIVYTADRTAEETCAEILRRIAVFPDRTSP
jgi:shikimate kinase